MISPIGHLSPWLDAHKGEQWIVTPNIVLQTDRGRDGRGYTLRQRNTHTQQLVPLYVVVFKLAIHLHLHY